MGYIVHPLCGLGGHWCSTTLRLLVNYIMSYELIFIVVCSVYSQRTITLERPEGLRNVIIDCPFISSQATPVWIIRGVAYYITRLPPQYVALSNGDLQITLVDSSVNQTTFQCIVPFENEELISDITLLYVTENGKLL